MDTQLNRERSLNRSKNFMYPVYLTFILIIGSIFLSFYIPYASVLGLIVGTLFVLKYDIKSSYYLLFALYPFAFIFKLGSISTSLFTMLEYLAIAKSLINRRYVNIKYFLLVAPFLLISLVSGVVTGNLGLVSVVKVSLNLAVFYIYINYYYESDDLTDIGYSMVVGMMASNLMGLLKFRIPGFMAMYNDLNITYINWGVRVRRFWGTFTDPNFYSIATIVTLGIIICLFLNKKGNLFFAISAIALILFGITTYSKSFFLMLILLIMFILAVLMRKGRVLALIFIAIGIIYILQSGILMKNTYVSAIIGRFTGDYEDLTTGRTSIWDSYYGYIKSDFRRWLIGEGCGAPYYIGASHNTYLETWYYVGFLGLLSFLFMWFGTLLTNKLIRHKLMNWYLVAFVALQFFFLDGFRTAELPFYMICGWIALNTEIIRPNSQEEIQSDQG